MDKPIERFHSHTDSFRLLNIFNKWPKNQIVLKAETQTFYFLNETDKTQFIWKPPFIYPHTKNNDLNTYLEQISSIQFSSLIMLISVGQAALGVFDRSGCRQYKVIRKYMTRKSQGKAQITYLNQKGKSRAGSRIRLANTIEFFKEICSWINQYEAELKPASLLYQTTPVLWGMMFENRFGLDLDKEDKRFRKIPVYVNQNTYKTLFYVYRQSQAGQILIMNPDSPLVPELLAIGQPDSENTESEDSGLISQEIFPASR